MAELSNALVPIVNQLANIFQVSTDYIQAHFMEYVLMYGRYEYVSNITTFSWIILSIVGVVCGIVLLIVWVNDDFDELTFKKCSKSIVIITVSIILLYIIGESICYFASPEIYSINQVMGLMRTMK